MRKISRKVIAAVPQRSRNATNKVVYKTAYKCDPFGPERKKTYF